MFVIGFGLLCPYNSKKIMQIHDNRHIAEYTSYDFKGMLEHKKVKSWLKSVSTFANTDGGSLFYGVSDEGEIVGLETHQEWNDKYLESFGLVTSDVTAPCFNPAYSVPVGRDFIKMMPSAPWSIVPILYCF